MFKGKTFVLFALLTGAMILPPSVVFANAGTGLVWAQLSYFTVINVVISIIESLLYRFRKIGSEKLIVTMLLTLVANYLSAFTGTFLFYFYMRVAGIDWDPLGYGSADESQLMIVFLVIAIFVSIIVEGLFLRFTLFRKSGLKSVAVNVILANVISNVLLIINFSYWIIWLPLSFK